MTPRRRRRLLLLSILIGFPLALIAGVIWYVQSGQLRNRLEAAWDLPGHLSIGSVSLVGLDHLALDEVLLSDQEGRQIMRIGALEAGDGLWSMSPSTVAASDWQLRLDADGARYLRHLGDALAAREGRGGGGGLAGLHLSGGQLTIGGATYDEVVVDWSAGGRFLLRCPGGPVVQGDPAADELVFRWQEGALPLHELLAMGQAGGWFDVSLETLFDILPAQARLDRSELRWRSDAAWDLALDLTWEREGAAGGSLRCQLQRQAGGLRITVSHFTDPRLPELVIAEGGISWAGRGLVEELAVVIGVDATGGGTISGRLSTSGEPFALGWGRVGERNQVLVDTLQPRLVDLAAFCEAFGAVPPAWLPASCDLAGSRWQGDRSASQLRLQGSWPDGRALLEASHDGLTWNAGLRDFQDRRWAGVQVTEGVWRFSEEVQASSLRLSGLAAHAGEVQVTWDEERSCVWSWSLSDSLRLHCLKGGLPMAGLLRWLRANNLLGPRPSALPEWAGPWCELTGSWLALDTAQPWRAGLSIAGPDWRGSAELAPEGAGLRLSAAQIDHPGLGRLQGSLMVAEGGWRLDWQSGLPGPLLSEQIGPWCDWRQVAAVLPQGHVAQDAAKAWSVAIDGDQGAHAELTVSADKIIDLSGQALPARFAQRQLPDFLQLREGVVERLSLHSENGRTTISAGVARCGLELAGLGFVDLTGDVTISTSDEEGLTVAVELPGSDTRITWRREPARPARLTVGCGDLARLCTRIPQPSLGLGGAVDLEALFEEREGREYGTISRLALRGFSSGQWLAGLEGDFSGGFTRGEVWTIDLDGLISALRLRIDGQETPLEQMRLRSGLVLDGTRLQLQGLLARQCDGAGTVLEHGLSLGAEGSYDVAAGSGAWSAVLDRIDLDWAKQRCPWLRIPADIALGRQLSALLAGRIGPDGLNLEAQFLPQGNDIHLEGPDIEIRGISGVIRLLIDSATAKKGGDDAPTDDGN
jgi:hypothetical protein